MGVLTGCTPREEVLNAELSDAIFAADFGGLIASKAPAVYKDPSLFFLNTHPAKPLCTVVQTVLGCLADLTGRAVTTTYLRRLEDVEDRGGARVAEALGV